MHYDIKLKTGKDLENLRESCHRLAIVLEELSEYVKAGITTKELDDIAYKLIIANGDTPAFLNYKPFGADYAYPCSVCISVNDEVVHGIAGDKILKDGDIVSLDGGIKHKGMISDMGITVPVGEISDENKKLLEATKTALMAGIKAAKNGNYVNDISKAIEKSIPKKYGIVKILSGHGVGYKVHEDPYVPNFDDGVKGPKLVAGMVLALEPMLTLGTDDLYLADDGYTFITADHKNAAHFEHTILITDGEAEILTL